jgi:hypothetical protein
MTLLEAVQVANPVRRGAIEHFYAVAAKALLDALTIELRLSASDQEET